MLPFTALCREFYFFEIRMLAAHFAKLLVLQLTRNQLLVLRRVIHAALAYRALHLQQAILRHVSNAKCKSQNEKF